MNRTVFWAVLITWLVISFVPALSAASLMKLGRGKTAGS